MNLSAVTRRTGHVKNTQHKAKHHTKLEQLLAHFYLPSAKLEYDSHEASNNWLSVGLTSAQGWRTKQEDAHLCDLQYGQGDNLALFGVFDGHNGHEISQYAADKLPELIKTNANFSSQQFVKSLEESFLNFDANLLEDKCNEDLSCIRSQWYVKNGQLRPHNQSPLVALNTGCTAVVALLTKSGHIYVANIGDSRCVLCIKGKAFPLSKDHKPTDEIELRRIERAGCRVVNGRINQGLNLSRAFGDHIMKNNSRLSASQQAVCALPDVTVVREKIRPGDFLVLACDGIWNCMTNKEVCAIIRKNIKRNIPLDKICEHIVERCVSPVRPLNGQLGGDNMTCIIIRFDSEIC